MDEEGKEGIWRERLPDACPPKDAVKMMPQLLLRLCGPEQLCDKDFDSHVALGKETSLIDRCKFSGCSMYLARTPPHAIRDLRRFPKLKKKTAVAKVLIDPLSGVGHIEEMHVNFYIYRDFNPVDAVKEIVPIDQFNG